MNYLFRTDQDNLAELKVVIERQALLELIVDLEAVMYETEDPYIFFNLNGTMYNKDSRGACSEAGDRVSKTP